MPILMLKFKENVIREHLLEKGASVSIGRKATNDIVIENLAVSGRHAKIDSVEDGFLLTDLQSKNGSFVNEQLITSHYLSHGDIITIGKHTIEFKYGEGEIQPRSTDAGMDQTMVMDTEKHREMLAGATLKNKTPGMAQSAPIGVLSFLAGGEGEVILTKKLTKIGKDASSDIVVGGLLVGKNALTISLRPKGYYISYVGGMAKPKVNDVVVKDTVKLNEFDIIQIGSAKLQFIHQK